MVMSATETKTRWDTLEARLGIKRDQLSQLLTNWRFFFAEYVDSQYRDLYESWLDGYPSSELSGIYGLTAGQVRYWRAKVAREFEAGVVAIQRLYDACGFTREHSWELLAKAANEDVASLKEFFKHTACTFRFYPGFDRFDADILCKFFNGQSAASIARSYGNGSVQGALRVLYVAQQRLPDIVNYYRNLKEPNLPGVLPLQNADQVLASYFDCRGYTT